MASKRNAFLIVSFCFYIGNAFGQSYQSYLNDQIDNGFYFSLALDCGMLLYPSSHGTLDMKIPYTATTPDGTTNELFHSTWRTPYYKNNSKSAGTDIKFEVGNHSNFFTLRIGGNEYATTIYGGVGHNFYIPINSGFKSTTWVLKPSVNIGVAQSFPFSSKGNHLDFLGSVDNVNRDINMLGYEFAPTYQTKATHYSAATTIDAQALKIYYDENDMIFVPRISLSRNNYEKLLCLSLDLAYYLPFNQTRKIKLIQDDYGSGKSVTLSNTSSLATFNNGSLAGMPTIAKGFYLGISVGINFSRKILSTPIGKGGKKRIKHSDRDSEGESTPGGQSAPNSKGL